MQKVRGLGTLPWMSAPSESPAGVAVAPEGAVCLGCGYALVALRKGKCPECSREFDPSDTITFGPDKRPTLRWLIRFAYPWWAIGVYAALCLFLVTISSGPGGWMSDSWLARWLMFYLWSLIFVVGPLVPKCVSVAVLGKRAANEPRRWVRTIAPTLVLVGATVLHQTQAVFWARWTMSRGAFVTFAPSAASTTAPVRVGLFHVTQVRLLGDGTVICDLGFPDFYGDGVTELRFGPSALQKPGPGVEKLSDGWVLKMEPF